tara:strand:- start:501 stop:725 length:225 start_codon:yes stop_codon:yes gene_type:complete
MVDEVKELLLTGPSLVGIKLVMTVEGIPNSIEIRVISNTMDFPKCPLFTLLRPSQFVREEGWFNPLLIIVQRVI